MENVNPIFDPATPYRIQVRGRVDVEWLQSFDSSVKIVVNEASQMEGVSVISVHTDQAGIVGLVRRLHGLGMSILQLQIVSDTGNASQLEELH